MKLVIFKKRSLIFIAILLVAIILCSGIIAIIPTFKEQKSLPIYSVERDDKKIAISFDCAWGTDYTDKLLSIMEEKGVRCTFFMVQFWTEKYPEYVTKINKAGHEIGTHSATHPKMSGLSKEQIVSELTSSSQAITAITGKKIEVFRPPFGDYNNLLVDTAKELGLYTIQWDVDSLDWKDLSSSDIYKRVTSKVKSGSIVLFHNNGLHTAEALPAIIDTLKLNGYEFVPIGELIYKDDYRIDNNGRQRSAV